jgi:pseudoazurin
MFRYLAIAACAIALTGGSAVGALAADHQVKMLNKGPDGRIMQFDPAFLKIAPGDTVTFVPTDKGHSSQSIEGMIPEGAKPWKGDLSQKITVTFTVPGLYGYRCLPHFVLGMVGLIEVGDKPTNLAALEKVKLPAQAEKRMKELFAKVE